MVVRFSEKVSCPMFDTSKKSPSLLKTLTLREEISCITIGECVAMIPNELKSFNKLYRTFIKIEIALGCK